MRKRQIAAIMAVTLLSVTALSGCGNKQPAAQGETQTENGKAGSGEAAENGTENGTNKLVVALQTHALVSDYENNYQTKYLEDKLGMDIEFYMLPTAPEEVRTKVSLMATSKENLPDVLIVQGVLPSESILQYGKNGVFLPLNDYVSDASKMPNYNAIPEEDRNTMNEAQTMADGNMYSLSKFDPQTWNMTGYRMFINRTWLDTLGLKMPKTTDELRDVLRAFHEKDPNGNGKQDEIGVYGIQSGNFGEDITVALMNAFTYWNGGQFNGGLELDKDGKTVMAPFTTEGWKKGLSYMNGLYEEGLLSAAIFTDDANQYKATLNEETNVVGLTSFGSLRNYPDAVNNKNFLDMEIMEPVTGPDGTCYTPFKAFTPSQELFIFNDCKNVDLAIKFADEFYEKELSTIGRYGQRDVDWTDDPEILSGLTNELVDEGLYEKVNLAIISNYWSEPSAQSWHNVGPRYADLEFGNTVANTTTPYEKDSKVNLEAENYNLYNSKHPEKILVPLHYTAEEAEAIQGPVTSIPAYVKQSLAEFITGAKDIDSDWDNYLAELKGLGLEEWIDNAQTAYDRTAE